MLIEFRLYAFFQIQSDVLIRPHCLERFLILLCERQKSILRMKAVGEVVVGLPHSTAKYEFTLFDVFIDVLEATRWSIFWATIEDSIQRLIKAVCCSPIELVHPDVLDFGGGPLCQIFKVKLVQGTYIQW